MDHKAGYVSIIGKPNAGKSTLMNALVGEKLSIITPKAQTTRHRILGIVNDEEHQIVFSDTPGIIKPLYGLQETMMTAVNVSLADADIILLVTDIHEKYDEAEVIEKLKYKNENLVVVINKVDLSEQQEVENKISYWKETLNPKAIFAISATKNFNVDLIFQYIKDNLPVHPPYFDKNDYYTDRTERFIISEILREKILLNYSKEIPYSAEVIVTSFKEEERLVRIQTEIIVERESQKAIIIGNKGEKLKKVGTTGRIDIEAFLDKKVFLEMFVKVIPDWRNKANYLKRFGYEASI